MTGFFPSGRTAWGALRTLRRRLETMRLRRAFGIERRIEVYRQLASMLDGGLRVERALVVIEHAESHMGRKPGKPLARLIRRWQAGLGTGQTLAQAMGPWVPDLDRLLLATANPARIADALREIVATSVAIRRLQVTVVKETGPPIGLMGFALGILYAAATVLVPGFASVADVQWTGPAAGMIAISDLIRENGLALGLGLAAGGAALWASLTRWTGRGRASADRLPPWSLQRGFTGAVWMQSLAAMISAGTPVPLALLRTEQMGTPSLKSRIAPVRRLVEAHGFTLPAALWRTGLGFPDPRLILTLSAYAETGDLGEALTRLARSWMETAERTITRQARILRSLAFCATAGSLALTGAGYMSMIYQMHQAMSAMH